MKIVITASVIDRCEFCPHFVGGIQGICKKIEKGVRYDTISDDCPLPNYKEDVGKE